MIDEVQKEKEELEAKVEDAHSHVQDCSVRYRTLRHERNTLLTRIKAANSRQIASVSTSREFRIQQQRHQDKSTGAPVATHNNAQPIYVSDDVLGGRCGIGSRSVVPTRIGRQQFIDDYDEIPCPISSFRHHVSISFAEVAPFMPHSQFWYKDHHNAVSSAITAYLQSVGADLGRATSEICWFNQLPFTLAPGIQLSHSAGALSPECCLSLSLAFPAFSAEALFLVLEHEQLEMATSPDFTPPAHPELDAMHDEHALPLNETRFDVAPEAPSAHVLARLKVRCCLLFLLLFGPQGLLRLLTSSFGQ